MKDVHIPLTNLQQVSELSLQGDTDSDVLAQMPESVTHFMYQPRYSVMLSNEKYQGICQQTALGHLQLSELVGLPNALSALVQLQHTSLQQCRLGPNTPEDLSEQISFRVLQRLTKLQHL